MHRIEPRINLRPGASNSRAHCVQNLVALALALCSQSASAFLDPPYITPASPTIGDTISVNVRRGECDVLNIGIVPPVIEQTDTDIAILFTGIHEEDPEFCYYGVGTETYPIGTFPRGSYTLRVDRRYGTFNGFVTETLGVIPFIVSGAPQRPVETTTLSLTGLGALLLGLIAASLLNLRERLS